VSAKHRTCIVNTGYYRTMFAFAR